jgi:hypothetical protein
VLSFSKPPFKEEEEEGVPRAVLLWLISSLSPSTQDPPAHAGAALSFSGGSLRGGRLRRYLAILAGWHQHAMDKSERFHNPLDSDTLRGPDWWFSARSVDELWDSLDTVIFFLNRRCKRVYRSLCSASIRLA